MSDAARGDTLLAYLDTLPHDPYPVQEAALLRYFEDGPETGAAPGDAGGVLVTAPTGMGKTLIAEGALYEALATGRRAYYTTPLIALTDQKHRELGDAAERWGFSRDRVGLVTGNRSVNPDADVLVVVAEVLFNRLLHRGRERDRWGNPIALRDRRFDDVAAVVMDEFHSFNEPQRGIVWELTLSLLPRHVRLMLLSATVGNAAAFLAWLKKEHGRTLGLVQGHERKVPLTYHWAGEKLLPELLEAMCSGEGDERRDPALVFCFNRDLCWSNAELLRARDLLADGQRDRLLAQLEALDEAETFKGGAGPKLRRVLARGIGVHHAGLLPKHKRVVEALFLERLLPVVVCTETLAAGLNLPARSVVLPELLKGPRDKRRLLPAAGAHQMFGRAGRPQFDREGHVYALAHEDDVKIARYQKRIDEIPEDTKDPGLMKARKKLVKKKPKRRDGFAYHEEAQFTKLQTAPPADLVSKGGFPWRLLAFLLDADFRVAPLRTQVDKRLMPDADKRAEQVRLTRMLVALHDRAYVDLIPPPPGSEPRTADDSDGEPPRSAAPELGSEPEPEPEESTPAPGGLLAGLSLGGAATGRAAAPPPSSGGGKASAAAPKVDALAGYDPQEAEPTDGLAELLAFRAVHPLYGGFLLDHLGKLEKHERLQAMESVLEMPGSVAKKVRVPWPDELPPGPHTLGVIDPSLVAGGTFSHDDLYPKPIEDQKDEGASGSSLRFPVPLADKLAALYRQDVRYGGDPPTTAVWCAGRLIEDGGDFYTFIANTDLAMQEGIVFKHLLRLILLCGELSAVTPVGVEEADWKQEMEQLADLLTGIVVEVDPQSAETSEGVRYI
ncbi:DEAD/DEAH box helicase [Phycisphaera mikurensis]|uniref:Putative ATP-dependent helicase n=1 Tax=Phycisphaera mikurensis (strain NBRC 102666 / KCTC 22515 / FYK2301M01) TaxID=1142394 RepID=I0IIB4_PHYMF|nr:DEAD/DEAH box helicase [Phycisphaera mikurensis]MBB6442435.1 superfamily II DNA/RNA helicase [Phycisphaera mikurensis]BAM05002.1 putative ATP-dependent helicase [Phycisphaera mikurensis NBRC 102666]